MKIDLTKDLWYIKRVKDQRFYKVKNFFVLHSGNKIFNSDFNFYGRFGESGNFLEGYNGIFNLNRSQKVPEITLDEFIELTEPKFVLPEKWCIKLDCQEAVDYANKFGKGYSAGKYIINSSTYIHFPNHSEDHSTSSKVVKGYQLLTKEQFFKHVVKQEFILPEKYFITKIDHPDYQLICDYFHEKSGYEDFGNYDNLCYNSEWKVYKGYSAGLGNTTGFTEVSVEDFVKHVLNKETKMEQRLTRRQLITLYNSDNCSKWKKIIGQYVTTFSAFDTDDVTRVIQQPALDLLIKEGSEKQKKLVTDLGIVLKEDKNAFVKEFKYDETRIISSKLFGNDNVLLICHNSQDRINRPDLRGRAFVVSKDYTVKTYSSEGNNTIIEIVKK